MGGSGLLPCLYLLLLERCRCRKCTLDRTRFRLRFPCRIRHSGRGRFRRRLESFEVAALDRAPLLLRQPSSLTLTLLRPSLAEGRSCPNPQPCEYLILACQQTVPMSYPYCSGTVWHGTLTYPYNGIIYFDKRFLRHIFEGAREVHTQSGDRALAWSWVRWEARFGERREQAVGGLLDGADEFPIATSQSQLGPKGSNTLGWLKWYPPSVDAPNSRKIKFDLGSEFGTVNIWQDNMTRWHGNINHMARNAIFCHKKFGKRGAPFLSKWAITRVVQARKWNFEKGLKPWKIDEKSHY